jgi:Flagellin and related hook-associated proteins
VKLEDVEDLLIAKEDGYATVYDEVLERVSNRRTLLGSFQSRLNHALELADISQENIAATQSRIIDVDYAEESTNLVKAKMLINTANSLLMQNQVDMGRALQLISGR